MTWRITVATEFCDPNITLVLAFVDSRLLEIIRQGHTSHSFLIYFVLILYEKVYSNSKIQLDYKLLVSYALADSDPKNKPAGTK